MITAPVSHRTSPRVVLLAAVLLAAGCQSAPVLRPLNPAAEATPDRCDSIQSEIIYNKNLQKQSQQTYGSADIAADAVGKADQRIEVLRQRYRDLGCDAPAKPDASTNGPSVPLP